MNEYDYIIYTRGFFDKITGEGKWIAFITKDDKILKTLKGKKENTNEARIKLISIANALSKIDKGSNVLLLCDSQYATNAIIRNWYTNWNNKGWQTKQGTSVQNQDIWKYLIKKLPLINIEIRWLQDYDSSPIGKKMFVAISKI